MYGFELNIAGNASQTLNKMFKGINDLRAGAKAMQSQFDAVKLPPVTLPAKNPFRAVVPSVTAAQVPPSVLETIGGLKDMDNQIRQIGQTGNSVFGGLKNQIAGAFAVGGLASFGSEVISTLSDFQKYEAVLTNTLGSNESAKTMMSQITDFAAKTPFGVNELTESFVKLANQGFTPNMAQMKSLGDLASSTGKSMDMLAEGFLDARMGEFERLKEFGIKASKIKGSDNIMVSFKGQTKVINESEKAVQDYILSLGSIKGVAGSMDAISKTTGGQISNLHDQMMSFRLAIGEAFSPLISGAVTGLTSAFTSLAGWIKQNQAAVRTFTEISLGLVGALSAGYVAYKSITMGIALYQGVTALATTATTIFTGGFAALNTIMMLNPIGLIVGGLAALTAGAVYAWNRFEGFRGAMFGTWEVLKTVGQFIYDYTIPPLMALGDILKGVFTFDTALIQSGMNSAVEAMKNNVDNMMNAGTKLGGAFNTGWNKGVADFRGVAPQTAANAQVTPLSIANQAKTPSIGLDKKTNSIAGESRQVKNITIHIGSLISGGFTVSATTVNESAEKIKDVVTRVLMDSVNQVNYQ